MLRDELLLQTIHIPKGFCSSFQYIPAHPEHKPGEQMSVRGHHVQRTSSEETC